MYIEFSLYLSLKMKGYGCQTVLTKPEDIGLIPRICTDIATAQGIQDSRKVDVTVGESKVEVERKKTL